MEEADAKKGSGEKVFYTEAAFFKALELLSNTRIKNYMLYKIIDRHLSDTPPNDLGKLIDIFNKECDKKEYKEEINRYYPKLKRLKRGMPAPEFSFPDRNGKMVSLSDFKGKLVYVDVWNTYCSGCLREFPKLEKLMEKYKGKPIVFIGISYDSDEKLWKKTMKEKGLHGIQLFANGWRTQFGKDYLVYANPRFILIDKEGNFINAKAPKPSGNIEELIEQHL